MSTPTGRDMIFYLRGGWSTRCDFCDRDWPEEKIHPEEAGAWVCEECLERWDAEDKRRRAAGVIE